LLDSRYSIIQLRARCPVSTIRAQRAGIRRELMQRVL
jgi:hypothetical protein